MLFIIHFLLFLLASNWKHVIKIVLSLSSGELREWCSFRIFRNSKFLKSRNFSSREISFSEKLHSPAQGEATTATCRNTRSQVMHKVFHPHTNYNNNNNNNKHDKIQQYALLSNSTRLCIHPCSEEHYKRKAEEGPAGTNIVTQDVAPKRRRLGLSHKAPVSTNISPSPRRSFKSPLLAPTPIITTSTITNQSYFYNVVFSLAHKKKKIYVEGILPFFSYLHAL